MTSYSDTRLNLSVTIRQKWCHGRVFALHPVPLHQNSAFPVMYKTAILTLSSVGTPTNSKYFSAFRIHPSVSSPANSENVSLGPLATALC